MRRWLLVGLITAFPTAGFAVDCTTIDGNRLLPSCAFESNADVAAWTLTNGDSATQSAGTGETGGSVLVSSPPLALWIASLESPCLAGTPLTFVSGGFVARLANKATASCNVEIFQYTDGACSNLSGSQVGPVVAMTGAYQPVEGIDLFLTGTTNSFRLTTYCNSAAGAFDIHIDNAFVTGGIAGSVIEVPALGGIGLWILGGLLAGAALLVLRART